VFLHNIGIAPFYGARLWTEGPDTLLVSSDGVVYRQALTPDDAVRLGDVFPGRRVRFLVRRNPSAHLGPQRLFLRVYGTVGI
jgi:hypothetical protein